MLLNASSRVSFMSSLGLLTFCRRAADIVKVGDFSSQAVLDGLNKPAAVGRSANPNDDVRGKSSTERVANLSKRVRAVVV